MGKQLGVEMAFLSSEERNSLMKGMILRRLIHGRPLTKHQLDTAMEQDFIEVLKRHRTFDFAAYTGVSLDVFVSSMTVTTIISLRDHNGETLYERGPLADEFMSGLRESLVYMIEDMPMSTRGLFDDLKAEPGADQTVTVSEEEFLRSIGESGDPTKRVIRDEREDMKAWERAKKGRSGGSTNPGPIILPP